MTQSRTHTCGELRMEHVGQSVTLAGWLENLREVSTNLAFVVLRDFYGTTQLVAESEELVKTFKAIPRESTISVSGEVRERASKNPKQATGDIEVVPATVEVLGRCRHNELPFPINRSREADETARLKYRYLDLRNPSVKDNIVLRCNVVAARVLVAKAGGDLDIAVEARGHQQLLELLRSLRQGIELAVVLAAGHEIVARALRAGYSEYRGRYLKETVLRHRGTQRRDDVAAENDVVLNVGISQVEIAVLEARRLVRLAAAVDLKGQLIIAAAAQHLYLIGHHLNIAGGELGVFA